MKATATLETVIDRVHQMSVNQYDEIVPVQDMEFDSLNQMWISGRRVEILPSAQRLLSNRLRVPFSYLVPVSSRATGPEPELLDRTGTPAAGHFLLPV